MTFHGLVLVHKKSGETSHDVVGQARRAFNTKAVGHCGTLDPLASGLMVLLINEATKISQYILEGNKSYRVRLELGKRTDTLDSTGQLLEEKPVQVHREQIFAEAQKLQGEMEVEVPIFSAVKVQGQKLYDYARRNEEVVRPKKIMKFWDVKPLEAQGNLASFELTCSKGTYIRSWVDMLGQRLGCGAMMTGLVRTWSDPYFLSDAKSIEDLAQEWAANSLSESFIPLDRSLPKVKRIRVQGLNQSLLKNGQISHDLRAQLIQKFNPHSDDLVQILDSEAGRLLALIGLEKSKGFVIRRVFNY